MTGFTRHERLVYANKRSWSQYDAAQAWYISVEVRVILSSGTGTPDAAGYARLRSGRGTHVGDLESVIRGDARPLLRALHDLVFKGFRCLDVYHITARVYCAPRNNQCCGAAPPLVAVPSLTVTRDRSRRIIVATWGYGLDEGSTYDTPDSSDDSALCI